MRDRKFRKVRRWRITQKKNTNFFFCIFFSRFCWLSFADTIYMENWWVGWWVRCVSNTFPSYTIYSDVFIDFVVFLRFRISCYFLCVAFMHGYLFFRVHTCYSACTYGEWINKTKKNASNSFTVQYLYGTHKIETEKFVVECVCFPDSHTLSADLFRSIDDNLWKWTTHGRRA